MDIAGKRVLVFGSGISGIGASGLLEGRRAAVTLYDGNDKLDTEAIKKKMGENSKTEIILGEFPEDLLEELDMVIISPGVPTDLPIVNRMREHGIPIVGEIELAYQLGRGDVLAITGTNGKTTTTALLGQIMRDALDSVFVVGNIGIPYTNVVDEAEKDSVVVAEMSSFQLESIIDFRPKVSAILNITPDHLNRHHTMEAYIEAKMNVAKNQAGDDVCVLNYEDEVLREFGKTLPVQVLYFSSQRKLDKGIYLENGNIIYKNPDECVVCNVQELQLLGTHNYENVMAAVAMAASYGVPMDSIRRTIKEFAGVEHRIEFVTEKNGVTYYNDSKGTNPDAAIKGIQAMIRPTYLIGGGYDKQSSYKKWINSFDGKVKKLLLIGQTKEKIREEAEACGFTDVILLDTFEDAVLTAAKLAQPGEAVLLSPACASWGMFKNYEERGDKFKEIVNSL
ncbi:MAG: UDP-N-acetylmuramoyl-L-alanine--D-glutamate ligase [Eubacteriales bacterium]|nr:UDP-N-acetylmuramoyl-L-alanine--D-glutamate ligase [Eubacteriales bacterium]